MRSRYGWRLARTAIDLPAGADLGVEAGALGCAIGLVGALAASRLLGSFLFQVSALDPLVLVLAAVMVLLLAVVACLQPAQRASAVDPMLALRSG